MVNRVKYDNNCDDQIIKYSYDSVINIKIMTFGSVLKLMIRLSDIR